MIENKTKSLMIVFTIVAFGILWFATTGFREPMVIFYSLIAAAFVFVAMRYTNKKTMESSSAFSVLAVGIGLLLLSQLVETLAPSCDVAVEDLVDCLESLTSIAKIASWIQTFGIICCFVGIYMAIQEVRRPAERKQVSQPGVSRPAERKRVSQQEALAEFICAGCGEGFREKGTKSPCCGEPMVRLEHLLRYWCASCGKRFREEWTKSPCCSEPTVRSKKKGD